MSSTRAKLHGRLPSIHGSAKLSPSAIQTSLSEILSQEVDSSAVLTWGGGAEAQPFTGTFTNIVGYWAGDYNGHTSVFFDNNFDYSGTFNSSDVSNSTASASATVANIPAGTNLFATGLTYYFWTDATNYRKKVRYIDVYYWNGAAWVFHQTCSTSEPYIGAPTSQAFQFTTPMPVPSPYFQVRVVVRGYWNDHNGYMWVTEIKFQFKVD